jgi:hypothetical protein
MKSRYVTLGSILLSLVCLCLPWIEIRCDNSRGGIFSGKGQDQVVTSQSGLQMTYGGFTTTVNGQPPSEQDRIQLIRQTGDKNFVAPAVIVYALCLLFALAMGIFVRDWNSYRLLAGLGSLAALLALIVQLAIGFPIVEEIPRKQASNGWSYTSWFWIGIAATLAPLSILLFSAPEKHARPVQANPIDDEPVESPQGRETVARSTKPG